MKEFERKNLVRIMKQVNERGINPKRRSASEGGRVKEPPRKEFVPKVKLLQATRLERGMRGRVRV